MIAQRAADQAHRTLGTDTAQFVVDLSLALHHQRAAALQLAADIVQLIQPNLSVAQAGDAATLVAGGAGFQFERGAADDVAAIIVKAARFQALPLIAQQRALGVIEPAADSKSQGCLAFHRAGGVVDIGGLRRKARAGANLAAPIIQTIRSGQLQRAASVDDAAQAIVQLLRAGVQRAAGQELAALIVDLAAQAAQVQLLKRAELALAVQNIALRPHFQLAVAVHLAAGIVQAGQLEFGIAQAEDFTSSVAGCSAVQLQAGSAAYAAAVIVQVAGPHVQRLLAQQSAAMIVQGPVHAQFQHAHAFQFAAGIAQAGGLHGHRRAAMDAAAVIA